MRYLLPIFVLVSMSFGYYAELDMANVLFSQGNYKEALNEIEKVEKESEDNNIMLNLNAFLLRLKVMKYFLEDKQYNLVVIVNEKIKKSNKEIKPILEFVKFLVVKDYYFTHRYRIEQIPDSDSKKEDMSEWGVKEFEDYIYNLAEGISHQDYKKLERFKSKDFFAIEDLERFYNLNYQYNYLNLLETYKESKTLLDIFLLSITDFFMGKKILDITQFDLTNDSSDDRFVKIYLKMMNYHNSTKEVTEIYKSVLFSTTNRSFYFNEEFKSVLKKAFDYFQLPEIQYSILKNMEYTNLEKYNFVINLKSKMKCDRFIKEAEEYIRSLELPAIVVQTIEDDSPGVDVPIKLKYKNIKKLDIIVWKIDFSKIQDLSKFNNNFYNLKRIQEYLYKCDEVTYSLNDAKDFEVKDVLLSYNFKNSGMYLFEIKHESARNSIFSNLFRISRLVTEVSSDNNDITIYMRDRYTGEYEDDFILEIYESDTKGAKEKKIESDDGFIKIDNFFSMKNYKCYYVENNELIFLDLDNNGFRGWNAETELLFLNTDKAVYKPGSTIKVSGVCYEKHKSRTMKGRLLSSKKVNIVLKSPNYMNITERSIYTDNDGRYTAEFNIPTGAPPGNYTIEYNFDNKDWLRKSIVVEHYTPSQFDIITTNSIEIKDKINVTIDGSTKYKSGYVLKGAKIKYYLFETEGRFFRFIPNDKKDIIFEKELQSDKDGRFLISFTCEKPFSNWKNLNLLIEVTDEAGMTESETIDIYKGKDNISVSIDSEDYYYTPETKIRFIATNSTNDTISLNLDYEVKKLLNPKVYRNVIEERFDEIYVDDYKSKFKYDNFLMKSDEETKKFTSISKSKIHSGEYLDKKTIPNEAGVYQIIVSYDDGFNKISESKIITVKVPGEKSNDSDLFSIKIPDQDPFQSEEIYFYCNTGLEEGLISIYAVDEFGNYERDTFEIGKKVKKYDIDVSDLKGSNILFEVLYYGENIFLMESKNFIFKYDSYLNLELLNLETSYEPQKSAEIKLKLSDSKGNPVKNSLCWVTIFDEALDKISPYRINLVNSNIAELVVKHRAGMGIKKPYRDIQNYIQATPDMNSQHYRGGRSKAKGAPDGIMMAESSASDNSQESTKIRDLTADYLFFATNLKTDENGEAVVYFTNPEKTGKFNLVAFSCNNDLKSGMARTNFITNKEFYMESILPSYLYEGDSLNLNVKLINSLDSSIEAKTEIKIIAPDLSDITDKFLKQKNFTTSIIQKSYEILRIPLIVNSVPYPVKFEIISTAGDRTDAIEGLIPILTNSIRFTDTEVITLKPNQAKEVNFTGIDTKYDTYVIEGTSTPMWYALFPDIVYDFKEDELGSVTNNLYGYSSLKRILKMKPDLESRIKALNTLTSDKSFLSLITRNPELKSFLIENSPWYHEFTNLKDQLSDLAKNFNTERIESRYDENIFSLNKLIESNEVRFYINSEPSIYALYYLLKANEFITEFSGERIIGMRNFLPLIEKDILQSYRYSISERGQEWQGVLAYLYLQKFNNKIETRTDSVGLAFNHFKSKLDNYIYKTSPEDQLLMILLKPDLRKEIARAFKGRLIESKYGSYVNEGSVLQNSIIAAHILKGYSKEIGELKNYIFYSLRTENLNANPFMKAALLALLDKDDLNFNGDLSVEIDGEKVEFDRTLNLPGYFKMTFRAGKDKLFESVKLKNNGTSQMWAAVYRSGFKKADEITSNSSGLSVKRDYLVYDKNNNYKTADKFNQGDKIKVLISIESEKDYDQLHLRDFRPKTLISRKNSGYDRLGQSWGYVGYEKAYTEIFFNYLRKGKTIIEYDLYALDDGKFSTGPAVITSFLSPEFNGRSKGCTIHISSGTGR
ncbi:MAG: hypothetical protein JXR48_11915 [Candidatus Delongbacteria bacterium]|nr:hypothetical protein [Candidatus Delongbacteria bacterium]MBN2835658.1 hypothetical protein [Candidatus Delongbacteria bacterium]